MTMTPLSPALPTLTTSSSLRTLGSRDLGRWDLGRWDLGRWLGELLSGSPSTDLAATTRRPSARTSSAEPFSERRPSRLDAAFDRQRVLRAAERGRAIERGSVARPYSAQPGPSALDPLHEYEGLEVHLVVAAGAIDHQARELALLDRRHVVTIDVLCPIEDPRLGREGSTAALETVRRLARHGLTTRLLVTPRQEDLRPAAPSCLDRLVRGAREAGASDIRWGGPRWSGIRPADTTQRWTREIELQRLRHGFTSPR